MTPHSAAYLARLHEALGRIHAPLVLHWLREVDHVTDRALLNAYIEQQEGTGPRVKGRYLVYTDSLGYETVGMGRLLSRGFSRDEIELMRDNDLDEAIKDLIQFPWFQEMNDARQTAVVSWRFNLGSTRWRKWTATIGFLVRRDYAGAARQFRTNRRYFAQVGSRAEWIARVLETGMIV
jgi:GH24 family phage-related lysozyme (muramidase)